MTASKPQPRMAMSMHCRRSSTRRLVLTHLTPDLDPVVSLREAAETFDGVVDLAITGMVLEVGS